MTSDILGISEDNHTLSKASFGEVVSSTFGDSYMTCTDVLVWNNNTNQYDFASGECVTADVVVTNNGGWDNLKLALDIGGGIYGALATPERSGVMLLVEF